MASLEELPAELFAWLTESYKVPEMARHGGRNSPDERPRYEPLHHHYPGQSSLGQLDLFPAEILSQIFEHLDFLSLGHMCAVSRRARSVVDCLLSYRELLEHVPRTLTRLAETGLLQCHSVLQLRQTLHTSRCASCLDQFGEYLFLPTCERPWTASRVYVWPVVVRKEREKAGIGQIPICVASRYSQHDAVLYPGSASGPSWTGLMQIPFEIRSATTHGSKSLCERTDRLPIVRFPYITGLSVDYGHPCRGCGRVLTTHLDNIFSTEWPRMYPSETNHRVSISIKDAGRRRTSTEHMAHIRHCLGSRGILEEVKDCSNMTERGKRRAAELLTELVDIALQPSWNHDYDKKRGKDDQDSQDQGSEGQDNYEGLESDTQTDD
ncbi:hypothetical protein CONLIGDRAFT_705427 [Coniochaeta ligniaria NRRL 30616]|uniref:F-box domain-containing protein n=1 Tax=Coniochaeta ligniaria NRRL 30616 TaxID=1408157 RepID=A0A1J7J2R7_9PEZI|nr:hypothetical protein CONLIGDRAFT_705427 [Coniochaeta ligniaria NRRL 30616]